MSASEISHSREKIHNDFQKVVTSFKFKFFVLAKLPSAWFSGVKVVSLDNKVCKTSVPFKWFSQNPFKSTYFACQAMAAELSTGVPSIMAIDKRSPRFSMLVIDMKGSYSKKAVGLTTFVCKDVAKIIKTVEEAASTGEARTFEAETIGYNNDGEEISRFSFTWSFKQKSK